MFGSICDSKLDVINTWCHWSHTLCRAYGNIGDLYWLCYLASESRASWSRKRWSLFAHSMSMGNLQSDDDKQNRAGETMRRCPDSMFVWGDRLQHSTLTDSCLPLNNCTYCGKPAARSQSQASLASISANSEKENSIWFNYINISCSARFKRANICT